jgi:hypothetical protein
MNKKIFVVVMLFLSTMIVYAGQAEPESSGPQPEYMPYCPSPSQIAPVQVAGGEVVYYRSALAWNGREYGMAYADYANSAVYFRRFFADGTPASSPVALGSSQNGYNPSVAWNGANYGVAWTSPETGGYYAPYFALVSPDGAVLSGPTRISYYGEAQASWSTGVAIASNGSGFAAVWQDERDYGATAYDIYATLLNSDGTVAGSGAYHDILVSNVENTQRDPAITWSPLGYRYIIAYQDYQSATHYEIYGSWLKPTDGTITDIGVIVSEGVTNSILPSLAGGPSGIGLSWTDLRDGNYEVYFHALDPLGGHSGQNLRLTNTSEYTDYSRTVWTGAEYGVFFAQQQSARNNIWFQRVTSSGTLPGGSLNNIQVSTMPGSSSRSDAAFGKYGYLVSFAPGGCGNVVMPWGCNGITAPGCPTNLIAYGVSGSTATIAWQAALDNYTDIAYYSVYRNDSEIGKTSRTYYTDTGLSTGTTYNYTVRAVNAAQMINDQNYCGEGQSQTVYVKTNSSFTLMLDKSANPDAHLFWNDGGMNSYNIFRGTSPQVMSLLGTTSGQSADDSNVLLDRNNYFYTVDDPGQ